LRALDRFRRELWALVAVFGLYGVIIWPVAGWTAWGLIAKEVASLNGLKVNRSTVVGRDFVNIWHGGGEARRHGAEAVYDLDGYRNSLHRAADVKGIYTYSYPPHMLMLSLPAGLLPYPAALALWTLGGLAFFWVAARPWLHEVGLPSWSILILPGGIVNIWAGHFGFFIGGLALFGFWHASDRPKRAAAAFALMTVKPHLGLLVPIVLAAKQKWRLCLMIAAGGALLLAASLVSFGLGAWAVWLSSTLKFQFSLTARETGAEFIFMMPTVVRSLSSIISDPSVVQAVQMGIVLVVLGLLLWLLHKGAALRQAGLVSQVATFLVLPYVFHYDMVIVSLIALVAARRWPSCWYMPDRLIYGAAFIAPLTQVPLAKLGWWLSPVAVGALFLLMCWNIFIKEVGQGDD
jgi:alpha-1,2-mannosyltransferase